ncbi:MAG: hypothetical protein MJ211_04730 [Bacteroidales bacterium]|nr:hypothetical protein [Bacteroidales bacterium]
MTLQFALDIPANVTMLNVDELKQKLLDYANSLIKSMPNTINDKRNSNNLKPINELDPLLQELCGICNIDENDLNGDLQRKKELEKI